MDIELSFGRYIDEKNTKYEDNISPGVKFKEVPDEAESLVLIMDDPDAPEEGAFTHWLLWNIPPTKDEIEEDVDLENRLDFGGIHGENEYGEIGYGGPRPPEGEWHEYRFRVYAIDKELDLDPGVQKKRLEREIEGHVIDKAEETAPYKRHLDNPEKAI